MTEPLDITTSSPEETQELGEALGRFLHGGEVVLLAGELGAGKTCLTQGIARGLGIGEHVRSPTFVLVTEYHGRLPLYHVDLYRVNDLVEAVDLGLDEYIGGPGVTVVEWADKIMEAFPQDHLLVEIEEMDDERRRFRLTARGEHYAELLTGFTC